MSTERRLPDPGDHDPAASGRPSVAGRGEGDALELAATRGHRHDDATVSVDDYVTQWSVRVDPIVDGVPTEGFTTTVTIGENGVVEYANGTLGRPQAADEYPLIGTSAAIDHLNKGEGFVGPRPMLAETAMIGTTPPVPAVPPEVLGPAEPGSGFRRATARARRPHFPVVRRIRCRR